MTIFAPSERKFKVTGQTSTLINLLLKLNKTDRLDFPDSLNIIFTDNIPPDKAYAQIDQIGASIIISLKQIQKKPFITKKGNIPFQTHVGMILTESLCSVLLQTTDFSEQIQNNDFQLICRSLGWAVGVVSAGEGFDFYADLLIYDPFVIQTRGMPILPGETFATIYNDLGSGPFFQID